jgi:RNA recognition motif-containing protein
MSVTLFIGDLSGSCTAYDLKLEFLPFGEIIDIRIATDPTTGQSMLYGFVEFKNLRSAQNALNTLNGKMVNGREMKLVLFPTFALLVIDINQNI